MLRTQIGSFSAPQSFPIAPLCRYVNETLLAVSFLSHDSVLSGLSPVTDADRICSLIKLSVYKNVNSYISKNY